jgi:hypothetical protein
MLCTSTWMVPLGQDLPTTRTQLIGLKTWGFAGNFRNTCIQVLQNDFAHLEPSQTEPFEGGN